MKFYKVGFVIKKNNNQTLIVKFPYLKYNSKYKIKQLRYKIYKVNDFGNEACVQDWILFKYHKCISKTKYYQLSKIIKI